MGQSVNIDNRFNDHLREAKVKAKSRWKLNAKIVARFNVPGGQEALDKIEQFIIDTLDRAGHDLKNEKNVIGPDRKDLRRRYQKLKFELCK